jgi:hypothetical protein
MAATCRRSPLSSDAQNLANIRGSNSKQQPAAWKVQLARSDSPPPVAARSAADVATSDRVSTVVARRIASRVSFANGYSISG